MQEGRLVAKRGRGRPSGESGTREAIIEEARRQFGDLGYRRTSLRSIARGAGVDPRLLLHYFGSKKELFLHSVELPMEPERVVELVFARGPEHVARSWAEVMLGVLEEPRSRQALIGLLRAAVSEPEAAALIHGLLADRLLTPIASRLGGDRPELRAGFVVSQFVGLATTLNVVGLEPLATASREDLLRALTPVIEHYLRGDWATSATN